MSSAAYSISAASRSRADACSARSPSSCGSRLVRRAELVEERAVDDEVGVAADRAREVAVRGAGEAGVTEIARVVTRLLQAAEDERRKGLPAAAGALDIVGDALARLGDDLRSQRGARARPAPAGSGRRVRRASRAAAGPTGGQGVRGRGRAPRAVGWRAIRRPPRSRRSSAPRRARGTRARLARSQQRLRPGRRTRTRAPGARREARRGRSASCAGRPSTQRRARARRRPRAERRGAAPGRRSTGRCCGSPSGRSSARPPAETQR